MKKLLILTIAAAFVVGGSAFARTTEMPPSFSLIDKLVVEKYQAPQVDIKSIKKAHEAEEVAGAAPKFAATIKTSINPENAGAWTSLNGKQSLWRLQVSSKGAKSLNLAFTEFYLPIGAKLFIYSPDYKQVRGPFTVRDNNVHRQLWTPIVFGDESIIEVVVPHKFRKQLRLELTAINHDYRGFGKRSQNKSGSCNIDVACTERSGWESQIQSVAVISTGGSTFCTGFLVNNTAMDTKPLFMTAAHCRVTASTAPSLVAYWNYENSDCRRNSGAAGNGELTQFSTGSTYRAGGSASDFTVVEFNQPIDPEFEVFYAGWSASLADPTSAVAIHHPNTDEKRISFENDRTFSSSYLGTDAGDGTHIRVDDWDMGTTELWFFWFSSI